MTGCLSILVGLMVAGRPPASPTLQRAVLNRIHESGAKVSVAIETLDKHVRLLIAPDESYHAASTMKLPVMIELFREAHRKMLSLDDPVPVVNEFHSIVDRSVYRLDPATDSDQTLYERPTATYRELCEQMITVSSNLAANVLIDRLTSARVQATVNRLGAPGMRVTRGVGDDKAFDKGFNSTTTARALLTLLMRVARADGIDKASSTEMLGILERQKLNDAIPAGLPPGTVVAHKTGEITRIHHDAGIVYGPRPFVIVVLVSGIDDQKESAALIADIARLAYSALDSR